MPIKLKIFAVLVSLIIVVAAGCSMQSNMHSSESGRSIGPEDPLEFSNIENAKSWVSKKYAAQEFAENKFESLTVHSLYGVKGSGIQRVDAYFYGCDAQECSLLGMKSNTEARNLGGHANVDVNNGTLTIESRNNFRFTFNLSP